MSSKPLGIASDARFPPPLDSTTHSVDTAELRVHDPRHASTSSACSHSLSPGERTRAGLALPQARGVNLLILHEPTNHLDLPAIEHLESALESFDGTLQLVTHDRRMLESVRSTRHWVMSGGR